jgi:RimJ/RimL family protein N-acetyltransferase/catechol 2,3-dioxygenase-like lactoylglutathione lyase family enzyme
VGYNCFTLPGTFLVKNNEEALAKIQQRVELFKKRGLGKLLLLKKDTGEFVGTSGLEPYLLEEKEEVELGYRLCLKHWGHGYATEAARAILDYGFNRLKLSKVLAFAVPQNDPSIRILQKLGFRYLRDFVHAELPHKLHEMTMEQFQQQSQDQPKTQGIHRFHIVTLGVADLKRSRSFYTEFLATQPSSASNENIVFFDLNGTKLALYSKTALSEDAHVPETGSGFKGLTLAINVKEKSKVADVLHHAETLGATLRKPAQDVFWGGHSGYFEDFDNHLWEVAWNPFFSFHSDGSLSLP